MRTKQRLITLSTQELARLYANLCEDFDHDAQIICAMIEQELTIRSILNT